MLDDVLDVSGPAERTGKPRGTDLLDGTVTLPLILARARDPELARAGPARAVTDRRAGRGASATGSPPPARSRRRASRRSTHVAEAKAALARTRPAARSAREALELVADGVVERYA